MKFQSEQEKFGLSGVSRLIIGSTLTSLMISASAFAIDDSGISSLQAMELPNLGLSLDNLSVSGISSGAYMAVQLGSLRSDIFTGVGVVAGGPFNCAKGSSMRAQGCMSAPQNVSVPGLQADLAKMVSEGSAKSSVGLKYQTVAIIQGNLDHVVNPISADKLTEFYNAAGSKVVAKTDLPMGHGFPAPRGEVPCQEGRAPWINNCGYDGAGFLLQNLMNLPANSNIAPIDENLFTFDQADFSPLEAKMAATGYVYIPSACQKGSGNKNCRLHVALHGCMQSPWIVGKNFVKNAGYNDWAESNNVVVLYPSMMPSMMNPMSCWDWFGYTGSNYATLEGVQVKAILAMVDQLTK